MSFDRTPLMRRLGGAVPEEELELFDSLGRIGKKYAIGHDLGEECRADESIMILQHGWTMTYKILRGGDRQVIEALLRIQLTNGSPLSPDGFIPRLL